MQLQIRNLSKTYPNGVHALHDVTLSIPSGMFGLLGPNGAGKSTLMRTIATLQDPDGGSITLGGRGEDYGRAPRKGPRSRDARLPAAGVRRVPERERRATAGAFRGAQGH